jgi:regulator of PEP synthase PpsR (kinase-PPPase family)
MNNVMNEKYNVYLVSDSTGETLDRIFLSLKSQFSNFEYEKKEFAFVRTEQQIDKIIKECSQVQNSIILYTIVETKLAKYISTSSLANKVPCFGILGNLILSFSKLLNQKAIHKPSAQHVLDDDYYKRIEAIQFTMSHDDGKKLDDVGEADIILLGVSRTSKTPTSIYLANRGYKTINIPLVLDQTIPGDLKLKSNTTCIIGLVADPERLADIRRNRVAIMRENNIKEYTDLDFIKDEVNKSKKLFNKYNWPIIDVTRKSVEETAASILKILEIKKNK